ncbi:MAG: hypothetical protein WAV20_02495 [Blastocatellia bacterium]
MSVSQNIDPATIRPPSETAVATPVDALQFSLGKWEASSRISKPQSFLLAATIFILVATRLWHLSSFGLFGDEVFTLWTSAQDWRSLFSSVVGDVVHPPLFYALLKTWIDLGGQSLFWLKLLPASLSIVAVVPFVLLCRELRLQPAALNLALWLTGVNGFLINHGQELRMYSMLFLLTACSMWLSTRLINGGGVRPKTQIALFVVNLLLVFTHYYGWAVVALEFLAILMWKRSRVRGFAIACGLLVLCFSPWVYFVAKAAGDNPSRVNFVWNQPPGFSDVAGYYANLNGPLSYRWKIFGTAFVMVLLLSPVVMWGWRANRNRRQNKQAANTFWWLALFAVAPVAVALIASHLLPQPVWAFRYLMVAAPAYFLMVAAAAFRLKSSRVRNAAVFLIVIWSGLSGFADVFNRDKIDWQPLVQRMIQTEPAQEGIDVYVTDANVGNTIQFYLDQAGETRFRVAVVPDLRLLGNQRCWLAFIRYNHDGGPQMQSVLRDSGYEVGDIIEQGAGGHKAVLFPIWKR